jgi:Cu/Ag efflux pump CusA
VRARDRGALDELRRRRAAAVVIGGTLSSTALTLIVLPVLDSVVGLFRYGACGEGS